MNEDELLPRALCPPLETTDAGDLVEVAEAVLREESELCDDFFSLEN